jgi:hypothetical protein
LWLGLGWGQVGIRNEMWVEWIRYWGDEKGEERKEAFKGRKKKESKGTNVFLAGAGNVSQPARQTPAFSLPHVG